MQTSVQTPAPPTADGELGRFEDAILHIAKRLFAPSPGRLRRHNMDRAGYIALGKLACSERMRLSDLAALMELDISTVSRRVRLLEDLGLADRTSDPDDRRAALVGLTASGRAELAAQREERWTLLGKALAGLSEPDRAELLDLLERVGAQLTRSDPAP